MKRPDLLSLIDVTKTEYGNYCETMRLMSAESTSSSRLENGTKTRMLFHPLKLFGGPGSVVGIATAYRLDGPGIESRWGEIFRTSPDRP